jgi:hypothetical protein
MFLADIGKKRFYTASDCSDFADNGTVTLIYKSATSWLTKKQICNGTG